MTCDGCGVQDEEYQGNRIHTGWLDSRIAKQIRGQRLPWHVCVIAGALHVRPSPAPLPPVLHLFLRGGSIALRALHVASAWPCNSWPPSHNAWPPSHNAWPASHNAWPAFHCHDQFLKMALPKRLRELGVIAAGASLMQRVTQHVATRVTEYIGYLEKGQIPPVVSGVGY